MTTEELDKYWLHDAEFVVERYTELNNVDTPFESYLTDRYRSHDPTERWSKRLYNAHRFPNETEAKKALKDVIMSKGFSYTIYPIKYLEDLLN
jgi:hypothetical protein